MEVRHAREDYEAIQPFPTKRPHHVKINGELVMDCTDKPEALGRHMEPIIPDDEPVFLIRAKDIVGPDVVRYWAEQADLNGAAMELVDKVRTWADVMEQYAKDNYNDGKTPDTPEGILK